MPQVAAVPWELMHDGDEYTALHPRVYLSRIPFGVRPVESVSIRGKLRILIVWSQPTDLPPLKIEREQMKLSMALAPSLRSTRVEYREIVHCTKEKFKKALKTGYDVVYFTGHGGFDAEKGGFLCLEKGKGHKNECLYARELARHMAAAAHPPALVFLNCCVSGGVPVGGGQERFQDTARRVMGEKVPFVIATLTSVLVSGAQYFMKGFMDSMLAGEGFDIPQAVAAGRGALYDSDSLSSSERHSFYQYMLLSACEKGWSLKIREEAQGRVEVVEPVLVTSSEYPGVDLGWVRRIDLLSDVEDAVQGGCRLVGVHGVGGLGKTIFSAQWLDYLGHHTQMNVKHRLWFLTYGQGCHRLPV